LRRIIGIDPGTRYTGVGIIDQEGNRLKFVHSETIKSVNEENLESKLICIYDSILQIINVFHPETASIERVFHSVNPRSSLLLGHARGVALLALSKCGLSIDEYAPNEVKSAITGVGRASKEQVSAMIKVLLNLDRGQKLGEDESDALAIAVCHANTHRYETINKIQQGGSNG
jgi:crossover junction endodeoxyribonuclease RuvC